VLTRQGDGLIRPYHHASTRLTPSARSLRPTLFLPFSYTSLSGIVNSIFEVKSDWHDLPPQRYRLAATVPAGDTVLPLFPIATTNASFQPPTPFKLAIKCKGGGNQHNHASLASLLRRRISSTRRLHPSRLSSRLFQRPRIYAEKKKCLSETGRDHAVLASSK